MSEGTRSRRKAHQKTLTLETIGELAGGQAKATINAAIRSAMRDVEDRGADKKARKVTIELEFTKLGDSVSVTVKTKNTVPSYQTDPTIGELTIEGNGQPLMNFSPVAPENPDQPGLPVDD